MSGLATVVLIKLAISIADSPGEPEAASWEVQEEKERHHNHGLTEKWWKFTPRKSKISGLLC